MKTSQLLLSALVLAGSWSQELRANTWPQSLQKIASETNPYILLSLVSDSEKQASITPKGEKLRLQLEEHLQNLGAEILPLSLSERMKLERMWSLPYTGRFSDELKAEVKNLKAHLVSGSYTEQSQHIKLLAYNFKSNKTSIHRASADPQNKTSQDKTSQASQTSQSQANSVDNRASESINQSQALWNFETFEPSRERPEERKRRKLRNPRLSSKRIDHITEQLNNSSVLQSYKQEQAQKSKTELISLRNNLIQRAQNSFMTSSKIELYSRAFILNDMIKPADQDIKNKLSQLLLDHQEFFLDRKD